MGDEFDIEGDYGYGDGWEVVTSESTLRAARERLAEYEDNEPGVPFRLRHNGRTIR